MFVDLGLFLCGIVTVAVLEPNPSVQINVGVGFFLIGSCDAVAAAILVLFGYGWKRIPLFIACLVALPFWVGFTLY